MTEVERSNWRGDEALEKKVKWDMVDLSKGKVAVGCKWVFSVKHLYSSMERYMAGLVAKGCIEAYGIFY